MYIIHECQSIVPFSPHLKKKHHGDNFYKATFFMKFLINNKKKIRFSTDDLKGVLCSTKKARVSGFVNFGSR